MAGNERKHLIFPTPGFISILCFSKGCKLEQDKAGRQPRAASQKVIKAERNLAKSDAPVSVVPPVPGLSSMESRM